MPVAVSLERLVSYATYAIILNFSLKKRVYFLALGCPSSRLLHLRLRVKAKQAPRLTCSVTLWAATSEVEELTRLSCVRGAMGQPSKPKYPSSP